METSMTSTGAQGSRVRQVNTENPVGLDGLDFIEFTSPDPNALESLFEQFGFIKTGIHKSKDVSLYSQNGMHFILNREQNSFADSFRQVHGPSICATGFRVKDVNKAYQAAVNRGAKPYTTKETHAFPAVFGIGDSLIYFVEGGSHFYQRDFELIGDINHRGHGLTMIDHLTNNVPKGEMQKWCEFYQKIFNFQEVRYFDIRGEQTGLYSKVMRSPCGKITIPINEPTEDKSQIQEYLDEYHGSGIQHLALLTPNIIATVKRLRESGVEFLHTPDTYYEKVLERLPDLEESVEQLRDLRILVDGDEDGYLLQIFTKNLVGPIFVEIIQRKNHSGFGEGNFQALFDSIEEDQRRRGYLS